MRHRFASGERSLVQATLAPVHLACAVVDIVVIRRTPGRPTTAERPTVGLWHVDEPRFGAVASEEPCDLHAGLELDWVEGHGQRFALWVCPDHGLTGSQSEPAEASF